MNQKSNDFIPNKLLLSVPDYIKYMAIIKAQKIAYDDIFPIKVQKILYDDIRLQSRLLTKLTKNLYIAYLIKGELQKSKILVYFDQLDRIRKKYSRPFKRSFLEFQSESEWYEELRLNRQQSYEERLLWQKTFTTKNIPEDLGLSEIIEESNLNSTWKNRIFFAKY